MTRKTADIRKKQLLLDFRWQIVEGIYALFLFFKIRLSTSAKVIEAILISIKYEKRIEGMI